VSRAFTGWTVHNSSDDGFFFDITVHDTGEKSILGHTLPSERGIEDGLHVLSILANHPSAAQFISTKLAVRFVSDDPPQSLIDGMAQVWMDNAGEIRPVLRHLFLSPEFAASAGQKFRRPLDFFIGALRATGTDIHDYWRMESMLQELAHMPYGWYPPDGYPDTAEDWMTSSGLLARWNVAMELTHTAFSEQDSGMASQIYERVGQPATVGELVGVVGAQVFGIPLPADAAAPFIDYASEGAGAEMPVSGQVMANKLASLYGLMLASPLYQWR
ncbi:MAG: DUF1800 family protein, partial [Burkholderiales bacterium]|nr:DUF1800 family protein [Anaerolineae bacterium]